MLLLTMTARERAWRLLKITSPLIGWFDGDSPIPGISPWLAPLSRCTQYIVEVQRTLCRCLFVFEIRTVGWHQPSLLLPWGSSIAKVCSVKSSMRCEPVRTSRNCNEDDDALRVRFLQSQFAMLHFSSHTFGIEWSFFFFFEFRKPCRSNLGPSRDSGWKAKN